MVHEVAHGVAANLMGDPTAKYQGRLTLNPIVHLDLFGSILLPLVFILTRSPIFFAYAKPVPFNPYNLRNQRWGPALVGLAGPAANIALAILFAIALHLIGYNGVLPAVLAIIIQINIWLALFNLIPIPPLDGSRLLFALLPPGFSNLEAMLEQYGFFILILLLFALPGLLLVPLSQLATIIVRVLIGI